MAKEFIDLQRFPALQECQKKLPRKRNNRKEKGQETDEHRIQQRAKQIAYGENTPGFRNLMRILETNPSLLKGCMPVKPSVSQKCSKRSWDGQIRKWRRALHMYDFVDFGDSAEQTQAVREALIDQNKNPLFTKTPKRLLPDGSEILLTPNPDPNPEVRLPENFELGSATRVRYTVDHLMALANSQFVSPFIDLPDGLYWLDKRVDLEDDIEEEDLEDSQGSYVPKEWPGPFSPSCTSSKDATPSYSGNASVQLFAETPGYTSPTISVGHCDEGPLDTMASFGDALLGVMEKEAPWFPLEDYMPAESEFKEITSPTYQFFKPPPDSFPSSIGTTSDPPRPLQEAISYFTAPEENE